MQLQKDLKALGEAKIQVVAISYDSQEILKSFAAKKKISFPLLADPKSKTIQAFGILNQETKGSRIDGVPYPGTFLIDQDAKVVAKLFYKGVRKRHQAKDIIAAAKKFIPAKKRSESESDSAEKVST